MGYFWFHYKKNGSFLLTWWRFFGQKLKRECITRFFFSVGSAIGFLIARVFIIPERMIGHYSIDMKR